MTAISAMPPSSWRNAWAIGRHGKHSEEDLNVNSQVSEQVTVPSQFVELEGLAQLGLTLSTIQVCAELDGQ